jgi:hypothetical protein
MDIPEVSINPSRKARKKVSRKIQKAAQSYLEQKSISLEDLTQDQQEFVFKYIKKRRTARWVVPFMLFISIAIFCAGIFFLRLIMEIRDELAPDKQIVVDPNCVSVVERDEESIKDVKQYGLVCFLLGAVLGGALASCVSNFVGAIDLFINLRRDRKFLDAFLPPPEYQGNVPDLRQIGE